MPFEEYLRTNPEMGIDDFLAEKPKYKSRKSPSRVLLDPVSKEIDKWLKENDRRRNNGMRKQCLKCTDIHRLLLEKSHDISYSSVCKYVKRKKLERTGKSKDGNLTIEKNVTSTKFKKRMVVYDKAREMAKAVNKEFVESSGLEGEFDGMCRFEINLNSKEQIRSALGITDNRLISVLTSSANPIGDFVKQVVTFDSGSTICDSLKTEMRLLILKDCNYDLAKVEARIRAYDKHGNIKQNLAPFRALYESVCAQENAGMVIDVIDRLT